MTSRPPRALLLEREEALREVLGEVLHDLGFEVRAAGSRKQALGFLLEDPDVDLAVVDLVDPAAAGEAVVEFVGGLSTVVPIPLIVMVDGEHDPVPPRAVRLTKPFGLEELVSAVRRSIAVEPPPRCGDVEAEDGAR